MSALGDGGGQGLGGAQGQPCPRAGAWGQVSDDGVWVFDAGGLVVLSWGWRWSQRRTFLGAGGFCLDSGARGAALPPLESREVSLFQETEKAKMPVVWCFCEWVLLCTEAGTY